MPPLQLQQQQRRDDAAGRASPVAGQSRPPGRPPWCPQPAPGPRPTPAPPAPPPQRWTTCNNDEIIRPRSTQELSAAIKDVAARAAAAGRPLKMRTAHSGFGTIQSFPCAVQPHTPEAKSAFDPANPTRPLVVGILMDHMTRVLSVDKAATVMRVQAQIPLRDFYTNATAVGMSPPRSSLPWWQGLTLAGIFASSSHGSGLNTTSMIVRRRARGRGCRGGGLVGGGRGA